MIRGLLEEPETRGLELDDPRLTGKRRQILRRKQVLREIYEAWYRQLAEAVPAGPGRLLEIGSGAGFLAEVVDGVVTSDVTPGPGLDLVLDGARLPFANRCLRGIVMTNVLHHLANPSGLLDEAARCVRPGGVVAMIEPWTTWWSRLVYARLHHEPFDPSAASWMTSPEGPLSGGNGALPWILLVRDRGRFRERHSAWSIRRIDPLMPVRYLLTGGFSFKPILPGFAIRALGRLESALPGLSRASAMFAVIVLKREASQVPP